MKQEIDFNINNFTRIKFMISCELADIDLFSMANISFVSCSEQFDLYYNDTLIESLLSFKELLKQALEGFLLPESIKEDIGYLWNTELHGDTNFPTYQWQGANLWIGEKYLLWSVAQKNSTWLYNKDNKIFLEITPVYPWHFLEPEPNEQYYSYDEFIKNYKPIVTVEISKDIAKKWLEQTDELLNIIKKNDKKQ